MGAELWHHETSWHNDPEMALLEVQTSVLSQYDLDQLVPDHLDNARKALAAALSEDDPYGLASVYEAEVQLLEGINSSPLPREPQASIQLLRRIYANSGEGIGNVLDIEGIAGERQILMAHRLNGADCLRLIGAEHPTSAEACSSFPKIGEDLGLGECICFQVYDSMRSEPVGWQFVGVTID